jgi:hypothetical protein
LEWTRIEMPTLVFDNGCCGGEPKANETRRLTQPIPPTPTPRIPMGLSIRNKTVAPPAAGLRCRLLRRSHGFSELLEFG